MTSAAETEAPQNALECVMASEEDPIGAMLQLYDSYLDIWVDWIFVSFRVQSHEYLMWFQYSDFPRCYQILADLDVRVSSEVTEEVDMCLHVYPDGHVAVQLNVLRFSATAVPRKLWVWDLCWGRRVPVRELAKRMWLGLDLLAEFADCCVSGTHLKLQKSRDSIGEWIHPQDIAGRFEVFDFRSFEPLCRR